MVSGQSARNANLIYQSHSALQGMRRANLEDVGEQQEEREVEISENWVQQEVECSEKEVQPMER